MSFIEERFTHNLLQFDRTFSLTDSQLNQFRLFYINLVEWNRIMNLTTIEDEEDVYIKHFLDSLSILQFVPRGTFCKGFSVIDVGTGAGFPGLPLAISFPEARFTLVDSLGKRIRFLNDTLEKTGIHNVECVHARAEDLGRDPTHREMYDLAVSRAVAGLNVLNEYCLPFVRTGGSFISYKSDKVSEELEGGIRAAAKLKAELEQTKSFQLPETDYHRTLVVFRKTGTTPLKYPRRAGIPSKEPL